MRQMNSSSQVKFVQSRRKKSNRISDLLPFLGHLQVPLSSQSCLGCVLHLSSLPKFAPRLLVSAKSSTLTRLLPISTFAGGPVYKAACAGPVYKAACAPTGESRLTNALKLFRERGNLVQNTSMQFLAIPRL